MKKIIGLFMFFILLSTLFFWSSSEVRAEAAKCFKKDGDVIYLEQCNDFFAAAAAFFFPNRNPIRGGSLFQDQCYMARNGILIEKPLDSPECTRWQAVAVDNRAANQAPPAASGSATTTGRFECTGDACVNDNPITKLLKDFANLLSAAIGIIVVIVIIMAGIQYTTSGGNPQVAAQAKKRIINAMIALVTWFFLFGILQWLIPGGIFNS